MKFSATKTELKDALLIKTFIANDNRGCFVKDYNLQDYEDIGLDFQVKESMITFSKKGVIRGMHFQAPFPQAKLVTCLQGKIYDVIVDIRPNSPTYLKWQGFELTHENALALYVPKGFAHGYIVQEDSIVSYKCDELFYAPGDSGVRYDDPTFNIDWQLDKIGGEQNVILSSKDSNLKYYKT